MAARKRRVSKSGREVNIPANVTGGAPAFSTTFGTGAFKTGGEAHVPAGLSPTGQPVTGAHGGVGAGSQGVGAFDNTTKVTPPYLDPHALAVKGFNDMSRDNAFADITKAAGYGQADFGYTGRDSNGDGIPDSGFQVDPANPFSKAALLQRSYEQARRGTTNSYAAQGQLYSGALRNAQGENTFQNQQGVNANLRDFSRLMEGLSAGRRDTGLVAQRENADVDWQALLAAIGKGA